MWRFLVTPHFERAKRRYDKKRPDELAAVLRNLARLRELLDGLPHCRTAQAGYLHHEPEGVWAIDQKGPSRTKLQETRLYVFPVEETLALHSITLGKKNSQAADLQVALEYVRALEPLPAMTPSRRRLAARPAPRTYAKVEDLIKGEGLSEQVQRAYAQLVQDTCVTDGLTRLRRGAKLTQADIAKRLGVTQAAVSKIESGRDETLTLAIISAYATGTRQRINLSFGKPLTHVEAVKQHAFGLRHHLEALASLAHKDEAIAKDIAGFFHEASLNIDQIVAHCRERLPKNPKVEVRMQTQVEPSIEVSR